MLIFQRESFFFNFVKNYNLLKINMYLIASKIKCFSLHFLFVDKSLDKYCYNKST